jgi:hypothetical protein
VENKEPYQDDFSSSNVRYCTIYFRMDKKFDIQRREIYSLGSLLGEVGGLSGALANVSAILAWVIIHKYMYS